MKKFNWKRLNPDLISEALTESIEHGPCSRFGKDCRYVYNSNHCIVGWILALEGDATEEDLVDFDQLRYVADEALNAVGTSLSADEASLVCTLQREHDAAARKGNLRARYVAGLRLSGLDELADQFENGD